MMPRLGGGIPIQRRGPISIDQEEAKEVGLKSIYEEGTVDCLAPTISQNFSSLKMYFGALFDLQEIGQFCIVTTAARSLEIGK